MEAAASQNHSALQFAPKKAKDKYHSDRTKTYIIPYDQNAAVLTALNGKELKTNRVLTDEELNAVALVTEETSSPKEIPQIIN